MILFGLPELVFEGTGESKRPWCRRQLTERIGGRPFCTRIDLERTVMFDRISWNPKQMNGQPCIRGMRLTVRRVVGALAVYPDRKDLFRNYPDLEEEDVRQALEFAAGSLADENVEIPAA